MSALRDTPAQGPVDLDGLKAWLRRHGLDVNDVSRQEGIRIVVQAAALNDQSADQGVFIEATVLVRNESGNRFVDAGTGDVAKRTELIPMLAFPE